MLSCEVASILLVDINSLAVRDVEVTAARSHREAIELLRLMQFDLLLVGWRGDPSVFSFVRRAKLVRPGQRWMLLTADNLRFANKDEITARSLGALSIVNSLESNRNGRFSNTDPEGWERSCVNR